MPFFTRWLLLYLLAMLLAACTPEMLPPPEEPLREETKPSAQDTSQETQPAAQGTSGSPTEPASGQPGDEISPAGQSPADNIPAVQAAIRSLSQLLSVQSSQVEVISAEWTMWRDSCLGLATPGEMCLQAITPGYRVILQVGEKVYEIHTDETGGNLRHAPGEPLQTPKADLAQAKVIIAAVRALSEAQDLGTEQIEVVSIEPVEWPDACLGFVAAGEVCAAVITPGYRLILRSANQEYEVHTDATGESVRLKPASS